MTALQLLTRLSLAGGLCLLAWQVIATASSPAPESAALIRLAESHVGGAGDNADWAEVAGLARRALAANPLETRALVLLALAGEAEEDDRRAVRLVSLAGTRTLRDATAHGWLFQLSLRQGDYAAALSHADPILRVHPRLRGTMLPALMAMASSPAGRGAIVARLATAPPWRSWFLKEYSRQAADPSEPTPVYLALQSTPRPPASAELAPHLDRLIAAGRIDQARLVWLASLPDQPASHDWLYNGDFQHPVTNLPFDWMIGRVRGAEIKVEASPMGEGQALRVQFGKGRVDFRHVRKLLTLPPGSYLLRGRAMAVDLRHRRGINWRLACAEDGGETLVSTPRISGTVTIEFAEPFAVPSENCRAQRLVLELAARIAPEQTVEGGTVWFDSLQITGPFPTAAPAERSNTQTGRAD